MITKINDRKIEHQTNTKTFLKNYDNLIESKTKKKIIKLNSQLTNYRMIKLKKNKFKKKEKES
jgi:hypothetical protein